MKFQNETLAKLSQLEAQLNALDTEADQARQNKQSIDTLSVRTYSNSKPKWTPP